jgi:hypothetical protein
LHVLIPNAAALDGDKRALSLLPKLQALLTRMTQESVIAADDDSPEEPFEMALARAYGLSGAPGRTPWAAYQTQTIGTPCAWFVPAHLKVGMNDVRLSTPADLQVSEEHSRTLLDACVPLLADEGIELRYVRPDAWLAQGDGFDGLTCWSPRRAAGHSLRPEQLWQADDPVRQDRLARLTCELQMLLSAHPVNDAREHRGLAAINALWLYGAGRLMQRIAPAPGVSVAADLVMLERDGTQVWQEMDALSLLARLLAHVESGGIARLTLCGRHRARTWITAGRASWRIVARRLWRPVPVTTMLEGL